MPVWVIGLLRLASASLFFGEAWLHWFAETGYADALQEPLLQGLAIDPVWLDRGLGAWFFASGLILIFWKPKWLVGFTLLISMGALVFIALCWWLPASSRIATLTGNAILIFAPAVLLAGGVFHLSGATQFLLRLLFTISFATFGLLSLGMPLEIGPVTIGSAHSEAWLETVEAMGDLPLSAGWILRIAGIITLIACAGLWVRFLAPYSAVLFTLCGLTAAAAVVLANPIQGQWVETLHRVAPEVLLRVPFVFLALALLTLQIFAKKQRGSRRQAATIGLGSSQGA